MSSPTGPVYAASRTKVRDRSRSRCHDFAPVQAETLRLVVYRTWGGPRAEVFDLRVYGSAKNATK